MSKSGSLVVIGITIGVFLYVLILTDLSAVIQIGADEGFELAKVTLVENGFKLYSQVWNDQPPLHTLVTVKALQSAPWGILVARSLTIVSTLFLLFCMLKLIGQFRGVTAAVCASLSLLASPGLVELSSSCMLEIPALTQAVAALTLILTVPRRQWLLGVLAPSFLLGLALATKLIVGILLPLFLLALWLRSKENSENANHFHGKVNQSALRQFLWSSVAICFASTLTFVAVDFFGTGGAFLRNIHQTWTSHFSAATNFEYGTARDHPFDWSILVKNWDTSLPALIGVVLCCRSIRTNPIAVFPVAWLFLMLAVFSIHRPWWSYYYVHISIPLCWVAGIGIQETWKWLKKEESVGLKIVAGVYAVCAAGWMTSRVYLQISDIDRLPKLHSSLILEEIERYKKDTRFFYADEPIYSFHAGIPMPPKLAVVPLKRLWSGDMTNERIAAELSRVKPELIMIKNDTVERPFSALLSSEYRMVYEDHRHRLFVLRTAKRK